MADTLLKWFKDAGGKVHANIGVIKGQKGHLQFVVEKPIKEGERLLEMPEDLVLSLDNSDFAEIDFTEIHDEILTEMTPYRIQALLALFEFLKPNCTIQYEPTPIVRKKKKKKRQRQAVVQPTGPVPGKPSTWATFLKYISERADPSIPAYWDEDNRSHLEGTSLEDRVDDLDQEMNEELEKLIRPFFGETALKLSDPDLLTFQLFKKFFSFSLTYCWADESAEIFLAPLSDMLSYTVVEDSANVEIDYGETSVNLVAKCDIPANSKLYNFVGELGTAEYVWKWGVIDHQPTETCKKGSPFDVLQLEPEVVFETCLEKGNMEDDPLSEEKLNLLQEIGMLLDVFEIERDGSIPNDLLLCVKVLFMDTEEFTIYKDEMMQAGFVMGEDSDEEISENDEEDTEAQSTIKKDLPKEPSTTKETTEKTEETKAEEEEEEEEIEDIQILPEITNEVAVFEALLTIGEAKLKSKEENDATMIQWEKAGIIRKPATIGAYLKEIEKEIIQNFINECKKNLSTLSKATASTSKKETSKKRKLSDAKKPKSKKMKVAEK